MASPHPSSLPENIEKRVSGAKAQRAINAYLTALLQGTRHRGRPVQYDKLEASIANEANLARKAILVARLRHYRDAEAAWEELDLEALRAEFLKYIVEYSERHDIHYVDWREIGVPASDLKAAGIKRSD